MSKRTGRQGPEDINEVGFRIVQAMITSTECEDGPETEKLPIPSPLSAVRADAGRKGGMKGGQARKDSLTPEQRSEIARKAATKRWNSSKA